MKHYSKTISLFLCITLSANTNCGVFSCSTILEKAYKNITSLFYYPKAFAVLGAATLAGLFGYYYRKSSKTFPLEKLPKDIQTEIAAYLTFNKLESDQELLNVLNKPLRKTKAGDSLLEETITLKGKKFRVEISSDRKIAKLIKKGSLFNTSENLIDLANFYNLKIIDAEVSPNFNKLILIIGNNIVTNFVDMEKLLVIGLRNSSQATINFPNHTYHYKEASTPAKAIEFINKGYFCSKYRSSTFYLTKLIDHVAVTDDGNVAFSDSMGIYYIEKSDSNKTNNLKKFAIEPFDTKMNEQTMLKILKNNQQRIVVDRLEFNKQGTKLGIKYKNNKTEILPLPGVKQKKNKLQEYFHQKGITKKLQYSTSLLTNK